MAYKFQVGPAIMSGSLKQEDTITSTSTISGAAVQGEAGTLTSLDLQVGGITSAGAIAGVTTMSTDDITYGNTGIDVDDAAASNFTIQQENATKAIRIKLGAAGAGTSGFGIRDSSNGNLWAVLDTGKVSGSGILHQVGAVTFGSTLSVTGAVSGAAELYHAGAATFSSTLSVTGAVSGAAATFTSTALSDDLTVSSDILPAADSVSDIGSSSAYFANIYVDTIHGGSNALSVQTLSASSLTVSASTDFVLVAKTSASVTLATAAAGRKVIIKMSGSHTMATIGAGADDNISEVPAGGSLILEASGAAVTMLAYDAVNWNIC